MKASTASRASTLGTRVPQVNARAKVLGRALYAGDLKVPGMLHAKVLRSPYPSARIVGLDASAALALPGVRCVLGGQDAPRARWGVHHKERRILAQDVVRFAGEEVAVVAATSDEIARDALDLIRVEYEELPAILTPDEALDDEAPNIHPERNNISHEIRVDEGDVDAGFAQAALVYEATYSTHAQYPGYMEPMGTVAMIDENGRLQVWTATQSVFQARARLAAALELPPSSIRVTQTVVGGSFGAKIVEDANNLIAGLVALKTGQPVRVVNNRLEDFQACCSSLPERITLKLGMTQDGLITAKQTRIVADCGAYSGLCAEVMHVSAMRSDNMHRLKNVRTHATLVYTNNPPHGAFRGFGGTQMLFALNSHIDAMARQLGLDTVDVHKRNAIGAGETSVHGWQIGSTGLQACLDQCVAALDYHARRGRREQADAPANALGASHASGSHDVGHADHASNANGTGGAGYASSGGSAMGHVGGTGTSDTSTTSATGDTRNAHGTNTSTASSKRRGIGIATAMHVSGNRTMGNWDGSTVNIRINEDGQIIVQSGESDMGQGALTMLAQVVGHELDVPLARIHVMPPDTDVSPYAIGTLASRVTINAGNAAILAARAARAKLFEVAAQKLDVPPDLLELAEGFVRAADKPDKRISMGDAARLHIWRHGGAGLQVSASFDPKTVMHAHVHGNVAPAYSFAAQAVEVEVDTETGRVTVLDSFVADDCGKALNPLAVHGQSNGAAVQALGWTLYEQLQLDNGRLANGNFADYTLPTSDSVPLMRSGIVESNEPNGPYGAKGASETAILPGAPAIANAVFDAIGVRIHDLPITPEKVLAGLRALKENGDENSAENARARAGNSFREASRHA